MTQNEQNVTDPLLIGIQGQKAQDVWFFGTNQLNLMYMLAAGLVMSPKGFREKYYADSLNHFPGWIFLFSNPIPKKILDHAVSEADYLKPVIIGLNISSIKGQAKAILKNGELKEISLPEELSGGYNAIIIPTPLPTSIIDAIYFQSKDDRNSCEKEAKGYSNVPLSEFPLEIKSHWFGKADQLNLPSQTQMVTLRDDPVDHALVAGGMMAMLCHFGNIGNYSMQACQCAFDGIDESQPVDDPMLYGIAKWTHFGFITELKNEPNTLFWGLVDRLTQATPDDQYIDLVLEYLESVKGSVDEKFKSSIPVLLEDIKDIAGFSSHTVSELFKKHPGWFSRALFLFFLREKCSELIEFQHPSLNEKDYIAAALLFSAREKWIGLPLELRYMPGLNRAVSHRMAAMAHRKAKTGIELGSPPLRCRPLRELFIPGAKGWTSKQKDAALNLARAMKWDCISTKISLGKGDYKLKVDGAGVHIFLQGEVKAVNTDIDPQTFLSLLSKTRMINQKTDKKIREDLKT